MSELREPVPTTDGQLCRQEILSQPTIWIRHQPNSRTQKELELRSIPLRNVWRDTQLMFSHPTQITTRLYLKQRETSWHTERRIAARVAEHLLVVTAQGHTEEFA